MWLRFDETGNSLSDKSCFDNHAVIVGDPKLVEGLSYGQFGGNIALQCDGERDYFYVPEGVNGAGRITDLASGFSICSVIYPHDLTNKRGQRPFLARKVDDSSGNYGYAAGIGEDGSVFFGSMIDGNITEKQTTTTPIGDAQSEFHDYFESDYNPLDYETGPPNYYIVPDWYIVWLVSDQASPPSIKIYVNGSEVTTTSTSVDSTVSAGGIDHSTIVGAGQAGDSRYFDGVYQDYRFMKRQVTAQEVTNHWTNKLSISDIAYGEIFSVGAVVFN